MGFAPQPELRINKLEICTFATFNDRLYRISTVNPGNYWLRRSSGMTQSTISLAIYYVEKIDHWTTRTAWRLHRLDDHGHALSSLHHEDDGSCLSSPSYRENID